MSAVHPSWFLRGLGEEDLLVVPFDAPRPEGRVLLAPMFVLGYMERWLFEPDAREVLLSIHTTLFGPLDLEPWAYDELHLWIGPPLRLAFERMDLVVLAPKRRNASIPGKPVEGPYIPPSVKEKTWIEIVLLDSDDKPVPNELCKVTLPSGEIVTRNLDAKGFLRIDGIEPGGTSDVEFPNIDGREWGRTKFPKGGEGPGAKK